MIIDAFLSILTFFLDLMVNVFPTGNGFPQDVHTSAQYIGGYARALDPLIPFDTLGQVILLLITVELAILGFKTFRWLLSHVPFIGGRG